MDIHLHLCPLHNYIETLRYILFTPFIYYIYNDFRVRLKFNLTLLLGLVLDVGWYDLLFDHGIDFNFFHKEARWIIAPC